MSEFFAFLKKGVEMEEKQVSKNSIKKQVGITMIVVASLLLIFSVFRIIGGIQDFFLGVFGIMLYPILIFSILLGVALTLSLRFVYSPKYLVYLLLCLFFFICVVHIIFTGFNSTSMNYGQYLSSCYTRRFTPGGLLVGLFTFPLTSLLHDIAGIVIYGIAFIISLYFVISYLDSVKQSKSSASTTTRYHDFEQMAQGVEFDNLYQKEEVVETPPKVQAPESVDAHVEEGKNKLFAKQDEDIFIKEESPVDELTLAKEKLGLSKKQEENDSVEEKQEDASHILFSKTQEPEWQMRGIKDDSQSRPQKFVYQDAKLDSKPIQSEKDSVTEKNKEYLRTILNTQNSNDNPIINAESYEDYQEKMKQIKQKQERESILRTESPKKIEPKEEISTFDIEPQRQNIQVSKNSSNSTIYQRVDAQPKEEPTSQKADDVIINDIEPDEDFITPEPFDTSNIDVELNETPTIEPVQENKSQKFVENLGGDGEDIDASLGNTFAIGGQNRTFNFEVINGPAPQKPIEPNFEYGSYIKPPIDLLKKYTNEEDTTNIEESINALESVLASFGINAKVKDVKRGAAVTRYELSMPIGTSVKKIESYKADIEFALAAKSSIRIEAPIKGKNAVGVEVPNSKVAIVGLRDIIESPVFQESKAPLNFALGKNIDGEVCCCNLANMPHLLVAGSTGSGKSSCLNSLLISLLYHTSPEDLRILLVDPKQVEFTAYNNLPHMLMPTAITDVKKVLGALDWLISEMERRYTLFRDNFVRNLKEYNSMADVINKRKPKLPNLVLIVDELADLVVTLKKELEDRIVRLTQKARAAGIYVILATQRPSVDIITGVIKVNLPSRIAFAVTSNFDSKTILGQGGAENLLGKGDMLYMPNGGEPSRVQGSFVDTPEVQAVVDFVKTANPSVYDENIAKAINNDSGAPQGGGGNYDATPATDPLMKQALKCVIENGQASSSGLQRRFAIGFQRASKIIDQMEQAGFISASDGSKPRTVFITMEDYNKLFGDN